MNQCKHKKDIYTFCIDCAIENKVDIEKEIWNAAIEAALVANAKIGGTTEADVAIRRLLK